MMTFPSRLTDIHTHVLFGLDDGPATVEQSLELLSKLKFDGIHQVVCTSHYLSPYFEVSLEDVEERYASLVETIDQFPGSYPELALGAEVRLSEQVLDLLRKNDIPTLGESSYVLVELPGHMVPPNTLDIIYELSIRSYVPVLAHPERNVAIRKDPTWLDKLAAAGVHFQLTAECFLGERSKSNPIDDLAWDILMQGKATLIASDTHNTTSRPPTLTDAYSSILEELGEEVVRQLQQNANAVWTGDELHRVAVANGDRARHRWTRSLFRWR